MADPTDAASGKVREQRRPAQGARRPPQREPHEPAPGMGAADRRGAAADGADARGDLQRGDVGLRQLRRGARDGLRRGAAGLRAQPLRAHHPARRGDRRGARHRAAAARRAGPLAVPEVPDRLRLPQPGPRRLRAGRQPHRQHRGDQLRAGARARHPPAAGGDPRALHAGAPGPRAAADPPDHRRARRPARPPAHRAAAARHPHQPREGGRDRHHRRADDRLDGRQPPRADRRRLAADGRERDHHGPLPEIAQTLVTLGVELGKVNAVGDLQGGIEEAERILGYQVSLGSDSIEEASCGSGAWPYRSSSRARS